jgi:uncharacterized membrane protein
MLIVFPLGLLATAVIFDLIYLATNNGRWADVSYWMIAAGIVGGLVAAVFGLLDWTKIPTGTRAKKVGTVHGLGNVLVVGLFAASWLLRGGLPTAPGTAALACSFAGGGLALLTGWLGGELVTQHAVGVNANAGVDAPSSVGDQETRRSTPIPTR